MEYAKDLKFYQSRRERGLSSPLDELTLARDELVTWLLRSFQLLEASRQPQGTIPLSEILCFSDYFDLLCPLDQFARMITAMDELAIEHHIEVRKKNDRRNQSTGNS